MRVTIQFLLSLVLALLVVWGIRTYVFTVYSVPAGGLPPDFVAGNRVIVNRLDCGNFNRGEAIVFSDTVMYYIGRIEKLPGDTITLDSIRYVIPQECCKRCGCKDCRYYLVRTAGGRMLVHKHQMIGKAYKLF